jgi:primase-polymerase (primpol)-like protein
MVETPPDGDALPDALTSRKQWLCWRAKKRDGKKTKIPVDPASGEFASTTDPDTWSDFSSAHERVTSPATEAAGVGFVFTDDDPIVGVDLDDCRIPETGKTREWAGNIVDRLDSFTEISPSGTGYHVLVEGTLPEGRNRKGDVELYETARFFTVTGDHVEGTPKTIRERKQALRAVHREYVASTDDSDTGPQSGSTESDAVPVDNDTEAAPTASSLSDQQFLERAKNAANGEKFSRLWRGSTAGYESHSEADMALCSLLAFWTGGDATQLDRLFRDSGLIREKWDERHFADGSTYGEKTVERAIAGTSEFYEPSGGSSSAEANATDSVEDERQGAAANTDLGNVKHRETDRLERIEELETKLRETLDETERLQSELEAERERRRELEAELDAERDDTESGSWIPWR